MYAGERAPSLFEKMLHYGLIGFVVLVCIFGAYVGYKSFYDVWQDSMKTETIIKDQGFETGVLDEKPLPEFMIDTVPPDELERLKP